MYLNTIINLSEFDECNGPLNMLILMLEQVSITNLKSNRLANVNLIKFILYPLRVTYCSCGNNIRAVAN